MEKKPPPPLPRILPPFGPPPPVLSRGGYGCFLELHSHSPTRMSTLQTWLTTSRPGGHVKKSRYRDFAVSSSLNILRTKTVEQYNIVKQLK